MRHLLWTVSTILVGLWSLFAWGAYSLIDLFGSTAARHADSVTNHPETVEWLSWGLGAFKNLGLAAVIIIWGLVSLLILAIPTALSLLVGKSMRPVGPAGWPPSYPRPGYRDITPNGNPPVPDEEPRRIERY